MVGTPGKGREEYRTSGRIDYRSSSIPALENVVLLFSFSESSDIHVVCRILELQELEMLVVSEPIQRSCLDDGQNQ